MNEHPATTPPYSSKVDLVVNGLEHYVPVGAFECSICREPITGDLLRPGCSHARTQTEATSSPPPLEATESACNLIRTVPFTLEQHHDINTSESHRQTTNSASHLDFLEAEAEPAVRIRFCNHIFGRTCLLAWFNTAPNHNRCPECDQTLFPPLPTHITLLEPTREMRRAFADVVEQIIGDSESATMIRRNLMSDWTRTLMREVILQAYASAGYDVTFEYEEAAQDVDDDREAEDEDDTDSEIDIENHGDDDDA